MKRLIIDPTSGKKQFVVLTREDEEKIKEERANNEKEIIERERNHLQKTLVSARANCIAAEQLLETGKISQSIRDEFFDIETGLQDKLNKSISPT